MNSKQDNRFIHPRAEVEEDAVIGSGTRIWHGAHVRTGARIGADCVIGKDVYVDKNVTIGDRVKVQNGVSLYSGVVIEDDVFIGPEVTFTNDRYPRAFNVHWKKVPTVVKKGATIGANATIVCGVAIGEYALVGAGSVVTKDVPSFSLVVGNPARLKGTVDRSGHVVKPKPNSRPPQSGAVRVGIVGYGQMGRKHARVVSELGPLATLVGVVDVDPLSRREAEKSYSVPVFEDYRELLELADAIIITTPGPSHYQLAHAGLSAGKHLLVEKPFVLEPAQAQEILGMARAAAIVVMPGHVERFNPAMREMGKVLENEEIISLDAKRLGPSRGTAEVDVVMDLMIHDLDIILSLVRSPVVKVQSLVSQKTEPPQGFAVASLLFADGSVAILQAGTVCEEKIRRLDVMTRGSALSLNYLDRKITVSRQTESEYIGVAYRQRSVVELISVPDREPLREEVECFLRAVLGERELPR